MTDRRTRRYNSINKINNGSVGFLQESIGALSIGNAAPVNVRHSRHGYRQTAPQPTAPQPTAPQQTAPPRTRELPYSADRLRYKGLLLCGFTEKRQTKVNQARNEIRF